MQMLGTSKDKTHRVLRNLAQARLIDRLVALDGADAIAWLRSLEGPAGWTAAAIGSLTEENPGRAVELLREELDAGRLDQNNYGETTDAVAAIGRALVAAGPAPFLDFLSWAPNQQNLVLFARSAIPSEALPAFVDAWQAQVAAGTRLPHELGFLIDDWAEKSPGALQDWFAAQSPEERTQSTTSAVGLALIRNEYETGLSFYEEQFRAQPEHALELYRGTLDLFLHRGDGLAELTRRLPPGHAPTAEDLAPRIPRLAGNPEHILQLQEVIPDPAERFAFLQQTLSHESTQSAWSGRGVGVPGPNEGRLQAVRSGLEQVDLPADQRDEVLRLYDSAAFGANEADAE
jgi:hypothetical protein